MPPTAPSDRRLTASRAYADGQTAANDVIEHRPADVPVELDAADELWNNASRETDALFLATTSGFRDTLREYAERGND